MKYFLLTYDRIAGALLSEQTYADHESALADRLRLELEMSHRPELEIVVLTAESSDALRRTHARYFNSLRELAGDVVDAGRAASPRLPA